MQTKYSHFFMNIGTCEVFKDAVIKFKVQS